LKVREGNIAHAESFAATGIALATHGIPDLRVGLGPSVTGGWPMEHIAVNVIGSKMFERTSHGLCDLIGKAGCGIVGETMVLAAPIGELGLKEKVLAFDNAIAIRSLQRFANASFEIVPTLVGGVDSTKSCLDRCQG
jgi:hypothetical protein